jgi:hypothetical protein
MNLVLGAITFSDAGTQAFLPVRLAELHSAVIGKARVCELPAAAGYKPAGRTGRRPVFLSERDRAVKPRRVPITDELIALAQNGGRTSQISVLQRRKCHDLQRARCLLAQQPGWLCHGPTASPQRVRPVAERDGCATSSHESCFAWHDFLRNSERCAFPSRIIWMSCLPGVFGRNRPGQN